MLNTVHMVPYHLVPFPLLALRLLPAQILMLPLRRTLSGLKNSINNTGAVGVNVSKLDTSNINLNMTGYYNQTGAGQPVDNKGL
jgi:hypothetical protein